MLIRTERFEELDRRWRRRRDEELDFHRALERFEALWREARLIHGSIHREPGRDWREDLEADLAVARAVNGLPPT